MNDALFSQASWEEGEMDACLNLCASAELLHDLVQGIVSALEARDPHTAEHSLRVGDMVEQTCLAMGLPAEQVMTIHMAAHVHDIGKIAIPDSILLKKGRRTSEEHAVMRDHAHGCRDSGALRKLGTHRSHRASSPRALGWPRLSRWPVRH